MTDPALLPTLRGERLTLRPGSGRDADALHAILSEPSVVRWWHAPMAHPAIETDLAGADGTYLLVIDVDGEVAGGIQYAEETDPDYRHASIDIYLGMRWQGRGLGREAITLLVRFLVDRRGHHRLTIDPAADNERAIRCYESVGFRRVGVMRDYERGNDGTFHDGLLLDLLAKELGNQQG